VTYESPVIRSDHARGPYVGQACQANQEVAVSPIPKFNRYDLGTSALILIRTARSGGCQAKEFDVSTTQASNFTGNATPQAHPIDMKLEVITIPVSDADRAKRFYASLGWRLDADIAAGSVRLVQFTPPGSSCSIQFGSGLVATGPGSLQRTYLVVPDVEAARAELIAQGIDVGEVFHLNGTRGRENGPDPVRASYGSFAAFNDPDGNGWLLQEVTARLPGRVEVDGTTFGSASALAAALRRAEAAHAQHEKRIGRRDDNWADWYADYIVREQAGKELPL